MVQAGFDEYVGISDPAIGILEFVSPRARDNCLTRAGATITYPLSSVSLGSIQYRKGLRASYLGRGIWITKGDR